MKKWLKLALLAAVIGFVVSLCIEEWFLTIIAAFVVVVIGGGMALTEQ